VYKFIYLGDDLDCPKYVGTNVNIILFYILYYIAYLLAPWSRVLLEKLTGSQLVKKFPHFIGTKMLATCPYPEPIPVDQSKSEAQVYIL
jgi:hypothetical protein